ncbi:MAG: M14 family zinc carboxypeptidase [Emcibacteraceae bacterium]
MSIFRFSYLVVSKIALVLLWLAASSVHALAINNKNTCESESAIITSDYDGGGMSQCSTIIPTIFRVIIAPEDENAEQRPPWYSFKITNKDKEMVVVDVNYIKGSHQFDPKISTDGINWSRLSQDSFKVSENGHRFQLFLPAMDRPFYISAQPIFDGAQYDRWMDSLVARGAVTKSSIGTSAQGRPIYKIQSNSDLNTGKYLFLIGRQHPVEVTGAYAMQSFVETIYSDTPLAREFRKQYGVISIPLVNPDGVALGYWRHATGKLDTNWDWGQFGQKETRVISEELKKFKTKGTLELFIDFHGTYDNELYTQFGKMGEWPSSFTRKWTSAVKARLPNYYYDHKKFSFTERHPGSTEGGSANQYVYNLLGTTTIIYEEGENTPKAVVEQKGQVVAEEIMRVLMTSGTN